MKKLFNITISTLLGLTLVTTTISADVTKGEKIYNQKLISKCGISGKKFASKHSQDEWEEIHDAGKLNDEIKKICHGATIDEKSLPHIYDFAYENASDS
ncbi:MAG: cytochrome C [Epsilonproteobacteria bacterium]|nr:cytochrome C [Campylobacterota bacterium]